MQVTSKQMQLRHCVTGPTEGTSSSVPPVAAVGLAPSSLLDAMVVLSFFTFAASPKHTAPGVGLLYYTYSSSLRCVHHTLMLRAGEICLFNMNIFIQPARSIFLAACAHWPLFLGLVSLTVPMGLLPSIRPAIHPYTQTIGDIEQAIVFTSLAWRIMGAI